MLGFTVPLFVLLGIESLLALLLLGPRSFAAPALLICKSTRSSVSCRCMRAYLARAMRMISSQHVDVCVTPSCAQLHLMIADTEA